MKETIKNNRLILDFMGVKPHLQSPDVYTWNDGLFYSIAETTPEKVMEGISKYAKYHSDWNWLMEVVEKIEEGTFDDENSFNVTIGATCYCVIQDSFGELIEVIGEEETKQESVYKAVVEFIEWYNNN